eukprot:2716350-Amphidinium_carterae.1
MVSGTVFSVCGFKRNCRQTPTASYNDVDRTPPDFSSCSSSSPDLSTLDKTWRGRLWSATQTEGVIEANSTLAAQANLL